MKNRNHIDSKVLAQAAKWSKPKLRKKYTYKPKKITVGKYVKASNDPKLQRKYAKYIKNNIDLFKKKSINKTDDKVYNKFESMNNFSNLKSQNMEFAMNKNKDRKANKLRKLDSLAWESVTIPANDKIFGSSDGIGNECGVGQVQVIDSKQFFANYNLNELHIEEYVLDSKNNHNNNNNNNNKNVYDDKMGLKNELDINLFNNEANELFKLIQFSLHKMNEMNEKQTRINNSKNKKLKKRKSMKQKAQEKKLKALQKRYSEDMIIKTQNEIDDKLMDLLNINMNDIQTQLKIKKKQKWKQQKSKKIAQTDKDEGNEPPLKKRKLNAKKFEFRKQIETLHDKQNVEQITKTWNELLLNKNVLPTTTNSSQLLSHLKTNKINKTLINFSTNNAFNNYLKQSKKTLIIVVFTCNNMKLKQIENLVNQYVNNIDFIHIDINETNDIAQKYNINSHNNYNGPIFIFMDKTRQEIARIEGEININSIEDEINKLLQNKQEFDPLLLHGLADLGFIQPTKIQKEVIPIAMNGCNDILIAAATGSGKTLCFGIPIVNDLLCNLDNLDASLYTLILTPTRELAIQIESHLQSLCKYCSDKVSCGLIIGGMSLLKQSRILRSSPDIIIGTPGRIWKLMHDMESLHLRDLTQLRYLVLDEADRLLSSKHYQEINYILSVIKTVWNINDYKKQFGISKTSDDDDDDVLIKQFLQQDEDEEEEKENICDLPYRRQTFIVSATLTLESINRFSKTESLTPIFDNLARLVPFQENIMIMDQTPRHRTRDNGSVNEYLIGLDLSDKDAMITYLLQTFGGKTLIFANTIGCVKRIILILREIGFNNAYCIHSQQQQRQRLKNLDKFVKNEENCMLVCTDVCGRGLDIPSIDNVIHFQCPLSAEDYIHRSGRIGRDNIINISQLQKNHNSFLLVCAEEMKLYNKIILALRRPGGLKKLAINERLLIEIRRQVSICKHIASLVHERRKKHRKTSNLEKMALAAGIELDELNCRALNIMKTNNNLRNDKSNVKRKYSKKNKHKSFEYGIKNHQENNDINKEIKSLRNELKRLRAKNDLKRPKSSYLTKGYID